MYHYWMFNVILLKLLILHDRYHRSLDHRRTRHFRREEVHEKQRRLDKEDYERANLKGDQRRNSKYNDADSDESVDQFEERRRCGDRGGRSRGPRNQNSNRKTGFRYADQDDRKNTSNETDEDWSSGDGDKDGHRQKRRKSNGRRVETSKIADGSPSRSVTTDHDTHGYSSYRNQERRRTPGEELKEHWDEVMKDSDDHLRQKSKSKTNYESKRSSARKSNSRHLESSSRGLNIEDGYNIDSLHSDVLSDESREPSISDRYVERFKPPDLDKECHNNDHIDIDKEGRWDPEKSCDEFEKFSETPSAMHCERSPVHHGDKVNKRNRRKLRSSDLNECRRSRRESSRYDDDQRFSDLKSENTNSDEDYFKKSPRSSRHSRTKRNRHS